MQGLLLAGSAVRRRPALLALAAVLLGGVAVRVWFMMQWRPALLGYPDTAPYINSARQHFVDHMRPGGYPLFLDAIHAISPQLSLVPLTQHVLGIGAALLLFAATVRLGAPMWAGVLPAAVVALSGAGIWLEHAVLSDALFSFLVAVSLLATALAARPLSTRAAEPAAWAVLAGLAIGASVPVRAAGAFVAPLLVLFLVAATVGSRRRRAVLAVAFALSAAALPLAYMAAYDHANGRFAMTITQFYNIYGRVSSFADCDAFDPPSGTRMLCPSVPVADREGHEWWVFDPHSPIVAAWGDGAFATPPPEAAGLVNRFARAAILGQPLDYLEAVGRDLVRMAFPGFPRNPNRAIGNSNAGLGPGELVEVLQSPYWTQNAVRQYEGWYETIGDHHRSLDGLESYERWTRVDGVVFLLLVGLACAAPWAVRDRRARLGAALLLLCALGLLVGPVLVAKYDFRFTVPAQGPLAAAAAFGVWGLVVRVRERHGVSSSDP